MPEVTARILVIDDDPRIVNLLQETLEAGGYQAAGAYDGKLKRCCCRRSGRVPPIQRARRPSS